MFHRDLRLLFVLVIAALLVLAATRPALFTSETMATGTELLPDLQTLPPKDIEIVTARVGPNLVKRLRFDNEVVNAHLGPLELYPRSQDCDGDGNARNDRLAIQRIFQDGNGTGAFERGADALSREVAVGCMIFHPQHQHWHLENFARYELKVVNADGAVGAVVAASTKVSFCIIDVHHPLPGLPGSPASAYYKQCSRNSTNGLSVGWSDEYHSILADQYIPLPASLPSGTYCLVSTADPVNQIVETDDTNNGVGVRITVNVAANTVEPRNPTETCGP